MEIAFDNGTDDYIAVHNTTGKIIYVRDCLENGADSSCVYYVQAYLCPAKCRSPGLVNTGSSSTTHFSRFPHIAPPG